MRTYITIKNAGDSVEGWATNANRYYLRAQGGTCSEDDAAFQAAVATIQATAGLTYAQKMAQVIAITSSAVPAAGSNMKWVARTCGAVAVPTIIYDPDYPHVPEGGGGDDGGNNEPLPTDGTAWIAGDPNDHDDQGQKVTHSDPKILKDQTTQS